jgi:hypothetical protein
MRTSTPYFDLKELDVFYLTERSRIKYRVLPAKTTMMPGLDGTTIPALVWMWIRDDWSGPLHSQHSWYGLPPLVWIETDSLVSGRTETVSGA